MKLIITLLLPLMFLTGAKTEVYICDNPSAVAYHKSEYCRGLQKCTHEILKVSLTEAAARKLRPCKICY